MSHPPELVKIAILAHMKSVGSLVVVPALDLRVRGVVALLVAVLVWVIMRKASRPLLTKPICNVQTHVG